jgi:hypothetical protein
MDVSSWMPAHDLRVSCQRLARSALTYTRQAPADCGQHPFVFAALAMASWVAESTSKA